MEFFCALVTHGKKGEKRTSRDSVPGCTASCNTSLLPTFPPFPMCTYMYVYLVGPLFFLLPRQAHLPGASQQGGKPIGRADARQFIIFFFPLRLFGERARESPCGRDPCFCSMRDVLKTCSEHVWTFHRNAMIGCTS